MLVENNNNFNVHTLEIYKIFFFSLLPWIIFTLLLTLFIKYTPHAILIHFQKKHLFIYQKKKFVAWDSLDIHYVSL